MLDGSEQGRVQAPQSSEGFGIGPIALVCACVDQSYVSGIGDQAVVPELADQGAAPPRVGTDLEHHQARIKTGEEFVKCVNESVGPRSGSVILRRRNTA
jgi:hypothetical protein